MKKNFLFFILKRIIIGFFGVVLATFLSFFAIKIIPGDPFLTHKKLPIETLKAIKEEKGYGKPLIVQFFLNFKNSLMFSCHSPVTGESLIKLIFKKPHGFFSSPFFKSLIISLLTVLISLFFGIFLGSLITVKKNKFSKIIDKIITVFSVPSLITANIVSIFVRLYFKNDEGLLMNLFLPVILFSLPKIYQISQHIKETMTETLNSDHVKMLNLKGLSNKKIFFKHVLIISIVPIVSRIFSLFVSLLANTAFIEGIFSISGIGTLMSGLIFKREYEGIAFLVYFFSTMSIIARLIDDIIFIYLNPKNDLL